MRIVYNIFISSHAPLSGVINNCVRPLHRAVHHAVYRGQRAVHECGPLRRGVRRNVSIWVFHYQPRIRFYLNHPEYDGQITINIKINCPCDPCTTVLVLTVWAVGWVGCLKSRLIVGALFINNKQHGKLFSSIQDYYFIFYPFLLESYVLDLLDNVQK